MPTAAGVIGNVKKITSLIPLYAILPIAAMLAMNGVTYFGTRLITTGRYHYCMETSLDRMLPLVTAFSLIYVLAYVQWISGFVLIAWGGERYSKRFYLGEILGKCICLICFLVIPTTLMRPEITGNGLFDQLTKFIYRMDAADNLFPSIHCLESWMCYRGCRKLAFLPKWFNTLNLVFTLLVFASTVLLKQHVLVDIPAGVLAVEIGLFISGKIIKENGAV